MSQPRHLPPSGYTRAEPSPPGPPRRALVRPVAPLLAGLVCAALLAVVVVAGATGRTSLRTPSEAVPPEPVRESPGRGPAPNPPAAGPVPSPDGPAPPPARSSVPVEEPAGPAASPGAGERSGGTPPTRPAPGMGSSGPRRTEPLPGAGQEGEPAPEDEPAPPRGPSWIEAECRRRFPDDPFRASACIAALRAGFGN